MEKELNHAARDSLVGQITTAIETLTQKRDSIDHTISLYHQAQSLSLSEPLDQVKTMLRVVAIRCEETLKEDHEKAMHLAGLAEEINHSEGE